MREPNADKALGRVRVVKKCGDIVIGITLSEWRRKNRQANLFQKQHARLDDHADVRRNAPQSSRTGPDAFRKRRVMVSWQQNPRPRITRQRPEQSTNDRIRDCLLVEHVASDQHCVNVSP
ncbi:hypothetical protein Y600_5997 [Burkholderia pseudomallei MSHR3709]|nr:hypothetical protein Y600_5997 [Burkholderia pseudomallei MSHR3709]